MKPAVDGVNALDLKHADAHRVYVVAGGNHVMVELDHETAGNLSMPPSRHATPQMRSSPMSMDSASCLPDTREVLLTRDFFFLRNAVRRTVVPTLLQFLGPEIGQRADGCTVWMSPARRLA